MHVMCVCVCAHVRVRACVPGPTVGLVPIINKPPAMYYHVSSIIMYQLSL